MVHTNEPELNLDELRCAISDAAMIVARLSLDPNDGYIGSQVILSRIRPTISATRSMRPENITISGINFALSQPWVMFYVIMILCRALDQLYLFK